MMVLFDLNHVAYRCLFSARKEFAELGAPFLKGMMYTHIVHLSRKFDANEVYLMVDSKDNWRKKIYPEYKEHRKEKREEQEDVDWKLFFNTLNEFVNETKKVFPFYVLQVKYLEADDIAGVISKDFQHKEKIIVTSDGDYVQLLKYKNVKIYDPIKAAFIKNEDPEKYLSVKCLMGDKGDNIPAIKARVGEKTAEALVENPEKLKELFEDATVSYTKQDGSPVTLGQEAKEKHRLNIALIDLSKTPDVLVKALKKAIDEYELPNGKEIFQFLTSNKYRGLLQKMEDIDQVIGKLVEKSKKEKEIKQLTSDLFN
jgi:5'-3' exonuclease